MVFGRQQQEPISYIIIRYFVPSKTILPERGPITTPKDVLCQRRRVGEEGKHTRFQSHEEFLFVILGGRGQTYKAATESLNINTKAFRVNDCHYYLMLSRNIFPCSRNYLWSQVCPICCSSLQDFTEGAYGGRKCFPRTSPQRIVGWMDRRCFKALAPLLPNISGQSFYCDWVNVGIRRTARTWHGDIINYWAEANGTKLIIVPIIITFGVLTQQRDLWVSRGAVKYLPWPSKFRFPLPGLNTNGETIGINRHHLCYSLNLGQDMTLWQALLGGCLTQLLREPRIVCSWLGSYLKWQQQSRRDI